MTAPACRRCGVILRTAALVLCEQCAGRPPRAVVRVHPDLAFNIPIDGAVFNYVPSHAPREDFARLDRAAHKLASAVVAALKPTEPIR